MSVITIIDYCVSTTININYMICRPSTCCISYEGGNPFGYLEHRYVGVSRNSSLVCLFPTLTYSMVHLRLFSRCAGVFHPVGCDALCASIRERNESRGLLRNASSFTATLAVTKGFTKRRHCLRLILPLSCENRQRH
jgi:hypothetical protein